MESGYGADPAAVGVSVGRAKDAGAAGINMEDRLPGANELIANTEAAASYRAESDTRLFTTARCVALRGQAAPTDGQWPVAATLPRPRAHYIGQAWVS